MTLALIGLVSIQAYWVRNAVTLRQQRFTDAVNEALANTAYRYEKLITARRMAAQTDIRGRRQKLLSELDSLNSALGLGADAQIAPERPGQGWGPFTNPFDDQQVRVEVREEFLEDSLGHWVVRSRTRNFMPPPLGEAPTMARIDPRTRAQAESRVWLERRAELVDEIFQELISADLLVMESALDTLTIDSILSNELKRAGVNTSYAFAVADPFRQLQLVGGETVPSDTLLTSPYRTSLNAGNIFSEPRFLLVHFPHQGTYVLRTMWALLAVSLVFLIIIVVTFSYTVGTVVRQKKLSDIKNDFINNMTHELKTPVSTISLACQAMNDPDLRTRPGFVEKYLKVIADENSRLGMVVESVLRTAVIDQGEFKLKRDEVNIHALAAQVVQNMGIQAEQKGGRIEYTPQADNPLVTGDRVHLTNVIFNLLDNALKYTYEAPLIKLSTRNHANGILIEVEDNGIGIARDQQKRVFEKLYRVPTGNVHDVKGFGLGLSYVKTIVEKHYGNVTLNSDPGRGSRFTIYLPHHQPET